MKKRIGGIATAALGGVTLGLGAELDADTLKGIGAVLMGTGTYFTLCPEPHKYIITPAAETIADIRRKIRDYRTKKKLHDVIDNQREEYKKNT